MRWPAFAVAGAVCVIAAIAMPSHDKAVAARRYPMYQPAAGATVVATVPAKDPREVAMRSELRAHPDRVDLAAQLAKADIQRSRSLSDPRYLGRAQATLARWYDLDNPPPDVRLMRATIRQSLHDFLGARADLDALVAQRPGDGQAWLTRATVSAILADYAAARDSCARVARLAPIIISMACVAPIDGITGHAAAATTALTDALAADQSPVEIRTWAITALAELAELRGDFADAAAQFRAVLALDPDDAYARAGLADVLIVQGQPAEASKLLAGREVIDNILVRRAIAECAAHGPECDKWAKAMRDRIAAAAERGDRIHMREEAMFVLAVENDPKRALNIALEDWGVQKELADARLVAACAVAAHDLAAAQPVRDWIATNHVDDAQLKRLLP